MDLRSVARAQELLAAKYAEQRSPEWLELRENMITASDVASALGENRYETPDAFIKKKVLRTIWAGNAATEHGTKLEPLVRALYDERTGRKTHEIGLVQHRLYPWLGASPDGVTEDGLLVEIKCPLTRKIEPKVPKHYLPQVQLQLEITDLEECDFVQYRPAKTEGAEPEFVVVRVVRDRKWFEDHLPVMRAAWDRIVAGRTNGLCEILEDPDPYFKTCLLEEDNELYTPPEDADVSGVQGELLCGVHSTGGTQVPQVA